MLTGLGTMAILVLRRRRVWLSRGRNIHSVGAERDRLIRSYASLHDRLLVAYGQRRAKVVRAAWGVGPNFRYRPWAASI
jgi:hypothetical protein